MKAAPPEEFPLTQGRVNLFVLLGASTLVWMKPTRTMEGNFSFAFLRLPI